MEHSQKCPACAGTGHRWCVSCGGNGREQFNPWEVSRAPQKSCSRCGGSGRDPEPDPTCKGTGRRAVPST
jgi:DnaJ-class molecular chaperone